MVAIVRLTTGIARDLWSTAIVPATAATGAIVRATTVRQTTTTVLATTGPAIVLGTGRAIALEIAPVRLGIVRVHREAIVQARQGTVQVRQGTVQVRQEGASRVRRGTDQVRQEGTSRAPQGIVRVLAIQGTGLEMGTNQPGPALRVIGLMPAVRRDQMYPVQRQPNRLRKHARPRRRDQHRVALLPNKNRRRAGQPRNKGPRRAGLHPSKDHRRRIDPLLVLRGTNRRGGVRKTEGSPAGPARCARGGHFVPGIPCLGKPGCVGPPVGRNQNFPFVAIGRLL